MDKRAQMLIVFFVGVFLLVAGFAAQLIFSIGDALTLRDLMAYLVTLLGVGTGVASVLLIAEYDREGRTD